jgi:acetyl-CoA carboxylase/biotin carboxylase 1
VGPSSPDRDRKGAVGQIYTFRGKNGFAEDRLFRHIEAPHAFHLDLTRLANFSLSLETGVQTTSGNVHLYRATPRSGRGPRRYFARLVSFTSDVKSSDAESLFVEALDSLGLVIGQEEALQARGSSSATANHLFLNIVAPDAVIQPDFYEGELRRIATKYWYKMVRLAISTVELKLTCRLTADSEPLFLRFIATNPTGFVLKIDQYYEALSGGVVVFKAIGSTKGGALDGLPISTPYEVSEKFEQQRALAMSSSDTLYAYDWPILFESAAEKLWEDYLRARDGKAPPPASPTSTAAAPFSCQELVMCDATTGQPFPKGWSAKQAEASGVLLPFATEPGLNDAGMVAWLVTYRSPEYPGGREIVLISNDITKEAGSFGTKEDMVFFKASEYARKKAVPRVYLAANSGARIGMAQSLKGKFQVCWSDEKDPTKGFKYIYLSSADYEYFAAKYKDDATSMPVICSPSSVGGETRYTITDIIGEEPDLGVENLMGSGLIAGETARAYDEIFTLTAVVGRTVGIGAYLVRLGQRTIQRTRNSPIILTGYQALNKLMGREIYTTNDQLGGPMIMFPNGVTHALADTHMDSVTKVLSWLSFVPATKGGHLPMREIAGVDTVERTVDFAPRKGLTYDPRLLCSGLTVGEGEGSSWVSGFFDRHSFSEALAGWAKTVVVGRARLGGIPMGVIVTENRTAEALKPADPADSTSTEKMVQQAGGVWFPDSAYKTAQALRDFNREGLPCIIFANWRGFSGGQRDMFDEVLKFGSMIVDALVAYNQPLFVYIPPFAELRGGAWVVVDSTINADVMEFYAAEDARGGVLEAAGAASIKFRDRDIVAAAHRIDPALIALDKELAGLPADAAAQAAAVKAQVAQREKLLFGVYQQVSFPLLSPPLPPLPPLPPPPCPSFATPKAFSLTLSSDSHRFSYWFSLGRRALRRPARHARAHAQQGRDSPAGELGPEPCLFLLAPQTSSHRVRSRQQDGGCSRPLHHLCGLEASSRGG